MHVSGSVGSYLGIPRTSHTPMPLRVLHVGGKGFTYMVEYLSLGDPNLWACWHMLPKTKRPLQHSSKGVKFQVEAKQLRKGGSGVSDKLQLQRKIKLTLIVDNYS